MKLPKWMPGVLFCAAAIPPAIAVAETPQTASVPVDSGATAWMLTSTALVLLMVPGLAMFYGGLVRTKNVLGTMMHSFVAMAIIGVLWAVCGYALSFGKNVLGGFVGWDPGKLFLMNLDGHNVAPMGRAVPEYVFAMFQGKFAIITPALIAGAFAERVRFRGYCVLIVLWGLFIYTPLAHWVWSWEPGSEGFLFSMGAIDFAGGTVVHISAGISALVMVMYLGARRGYPSSAMHPNNLVMTLTGAGLLWVGWFGFNAGSSVQSDDLTARALTVTQIAAAMGALTWIAIEGLHHKKATSLGMCSGILAGLVVITPAAGHVGVPGAMALATIASTVCYFTVILKTKLGYDDALDVFGIHGIAGILGALCLSFFLLPGASTNSWSRQLGIQASAVGVAVAYSAVGSIILVVLVDKTLGLRINETGEMAGMDHALHGEHGYGLINLN